MRRLSFLLLASSLLAVPAAAGAQAASPFDAAASVGDAGLGRIAGRADLNQVSQSQQVGSVSDSSVNGNSVTGAIGIDDQAFQNVSGLTVLSANTGNNVTINASMNVNIAITSIP